jgi:heme a synthase
LASAAIWRFYRLCLTTLIAVYVLILAGGIVRNTGSGMGCPDWPRCFGSWVPPTSIEQLPPDYKENYFAGREKKNQKFVRYLLLIGMNETANKVTADKSSHAEAEFNPVKTWIEYTNRLFGVAVGLFIIAVFYRSLSLRKEKPVFFWVSLVTLLTVIFQGWFGSIVVSTNLIPWTISTHLFLALLIVGLLIYLVHVSGETIQFDFGLSNGWLLIPCLIVLFMQIFFGTEVRGAIDVLAGQFPRDIWISRVGTDFIIHRSFSWVVLILNTAFFLQIRKTIALKTLSRVLILLILCSLVTGSGMAYFNVPAVLQPIHLLLATVTFGIELFLFFRLKRKTLVNS